MTIEELNLPSPSPQDARQSIHSPEDGNDIESLLRGLVQQAKAAEERSAALAERVALLEERRDNATTTVVEEGNNPKAKEAAAHRPSSSSSLISGRFSSTRVSFAQRKNSNISLEEEELPSQQPQSNDGNNHNHNGNGKSNNNHDVSSLQIVQGVPESNNNHHANNHRDYNYNIHNNHDDDTEDPEQIINRLTLIEHRLQSYNDRKPNLLDERKYALPESTFSLLVTHNPLSVPFVFAAFSVALSISCLSLTLASSITKGSRGNILGVPAGVDGMVQAAQFLGALVGVLMEDEIPQGLQLIANGAGHTLLLNGQKPVHKRVIVSSFFRLIVGYLFLSSLFISLAQSSDVIEIFYDVLALEFVENIDDTAFALAKRGFFGRQMLIATNEKNNLQIDISGERRSSLFRSSSESRSPPTRSLTERRLSFSGLIVSNNRVNHFVRFIYFLNAAIILGGLGYFTFKQEKGDYRCNNISVLFDEEIWEHAHVRLPDGTFEDRLLIYSYFNGNYQEDGMFEGYPRYVEMNKNDGSPFGPSVLGAEIIFCHDIGSWVFKHPNITTSPNGKEENECSWLWRSPSTEDFDILSTSDGSWEAWAGEVKPHVQVSITCNECSERPDCNYHGACVDKKCVCEKTHFGDSCQFEKTCPSLVSEKAHTFDPLNGIQWKQENPIREEVGLKVYNRPVYIQKGLSGEPYDMRLYKILEKDKSPSPSNQPSNIPSVTTLPTPVPDDDTTEAADPEVTFAQDDAIGWPDPPATSFPKEPPLLHVQNEYDTAPDFADWDDFFESPSLHDLNDIMEDYSVVISFLGTRFYGTMIEPDVELNELFPQDYHAFWSQAFDVNRTFIISDTTFASSPVNIDFFEMRRRIVNSMHDQNVHFSYGPFGALIPLMSYQGTGFFHCLRETDAPSISPSYSEVPTTIPSTSPSISPSSSEVPTTTPSTSASPTTCDDVDITIKYGDNTDDISWYLSKKVAIEDGNFVELVMQSASYDNPSPGSLVNHRVCLPDGFYEFEIIDSSDGGAAFTGYYRISSGDKEIVWRGKFTRNDQAEFSIPTSLQQSMPPSTLSVAIGNPIMQTPNDSAEEQNEDVPQVVDSVEKPFGASDGDGASEPSPPMGARLFNSPPISRPTLPPNDSLEEPSTIP